jgi:WD repeat and SOF domain-containing protein 1
VTGGETVQLWNQERSSPFQKWDWGIDTVTKVKFNPVDSNLIACTSMDRGVYIYDIRGKAGLKKTVLMNKSGCVAWNPQEPINFTVGNEDGNAYSFDLRRLEKIKMIHKDHIGAILDIDYAPTGSHFVTGSFDKTVRIFPYNSGFSSLMYYTKRMQK